MHQGMAGLGRDGLAKAILAAKARGARVVSQDDHTAVIVRGRPLNHVAQLLFTLITLGAWGPFWVAYELFGGERRELLSANESGEVTRQKLPRRWSWWTVVAAAVALAMVPAMLAMLKYG